VALVGANIVERLLFPGPKRIHHFNLVAYGTKTMSIKRSRKVIEILLGGGVLQVIHSLVVDWSKHERGGATTYTLLVRHAQKFAIEIIENFY
jgi:hypothetical protein